MELGAIWLVGVPKILPFGVHYSNNAIWYLLFENTAIGGHLAGWGTQNIVMRVHYSSNEPWGLSFENNDIGSHLAGWGTQNSVIWSPLFK